MVAVCSLRVIVQTFDCAIVWSGMVSKGMGNSEAMAIAKQWCSFGDWIPKHRLYAREMVARDGL